MKKKYQNIFFIFGIAVLVVMVTQLDFQQVWQGLCHAGYWFVAVLVLWIFLYIFNTSAWYLIINAGGKSKVNFWWLTDGRRTIPHYGTRTEDWHREGFVIGDTICNDAYL